jgi:hypothetical protein
VSDFLGKVCAPVMQHHERTFTRAPSRAAQQRRIIVALHLGPGLMPIPFTQSMHSLSRRHASSVPAIAGRRPPPGWQLAPCAHRSMNCGGATVRSARRPGTAW